MSPARYDMLFQLTNTYIVLCRYNAVNSFQHPHNRHPGIRASGRDMGCLLWFMFCINPYRDACNIIWYRSALKRHPAVLRKSNGAYLPLRIYKHLDLRNMKHCRISSLLLHDTPAIMPVNIVFINQLLSSIHKRNALLWWELNSLLHIDLLYYS